MASLASSTGPSGGPDSAGGARSSSSPESLTALEQEVLDQYARLLGNLNNMSTILSELAANPSAEILDALRGLERKTTTVFTLLKASVYSIVLQQQMYGEEEGGGG
ncbi:hypothetical protein H2201_002427 [Coniosporium apollinis]|uniref:DASH complex subunit DAD3 n=1 Tax=Coniosporium apollinis TaxID=61459 RepID=A0ABQ9NZY0_9PEZI|nr:hypothetical protein H2201_002427 [Coniosporium apollinis]